MHEDKEYKSGSYLYIEGDEEAKYIFIIKRGTVKYKCKNERLNRVSRPSKAGDVIGFIESLCKRPRLNTAIAGDHLLVAKLHRDEFLELLLKNVAIALKVMQSLADTLRNYSKLFLEDDFLQLETHQKLLYNLGRDFYRGGKLHYASYAFTKYIQHYPKGNYVTDVQAYLAKLKEDQIPAPQKPEQNGVEFTFRNDQIIFCEEEPGDRLYFIKRGRVKILKNSGNSLAMLSILKENDIFGELAIISDKPRSATVISMGETVVMGITGDMMKTMLEQSPDFTKMIFLSISERVWFTMIRHEAQLYKNPITRLYAIIENKMMEHRVSFKQIRPQTFNLGINELLTMTGLTQASAGYQLDDFLKDETISLNFGQITVENPCEFTAHATFYKSRDNLKYSEVVKRRKEEFHIDEHDGEKTCLE
jgi:CRP-like cAMP-binding protein